MMICQECSSENPDGVVFCNNCGKRIVVAYSDVNTGGYMAAEETPLYAVRGNGLEISVSRDWLVGVFIPAIAVIVTFGLLLIAAGLSGALAYEAIYPGIVLILFALLYTLLNYAVARKYRKTGRPLELGGSGERPPSASVVMDVEDDTRKMDSTPSEGDRIPSRSERTLLRR